MKWVVERAANYREIIDWSSTQREQRDREKSKAGLIMSTPHTPNPSGYGATTQGNYGANMYQTGAPPGTPTPQHVRYSQQSIPSPMMQHQQSSSAVNSPHPPSSVYAPIHPPPSSMVPQSPLSSQPGTLLFYSHNKNIILSQNIAKN